MVDEIRGILQRWQRPAEIRLRAGEMTAQEMRTARAVLGGIASEIDYCMCRHLKAEDENGRIEKTD